MNNCNYTYSPVVIFHNVDNVMVNSNYHYAVQSCTHIYIIIYIAVNMIHMKKIVIKLLQVASIQSINTEICSQ